MEPYSAPRVDHVRIRFWGPPVRMGTLGPHYHENRDSFVGMRTPKMAACKRMLKQTARIEMILDEPSVRRTIHIYMYIYIYIWVA